MALRVRNYHPHTISIDGEPVRLRLARMTPSQFEDFRAVFEARAGGRDGAPADDAPLADRMAYAQQTVDWSEGVFKQYVQVEPGDLVNADEGDREITDGVEFLRLFQGEAANVLAELFLVNHLSEAQKKKLRSARDSDTGSSTTLSPAAHGSTPAIAALLANGAASVAREDATASSNGASSGTADPSSLEPAPCVP